LKSEFVRDAGKQSFPATLAANSSQSAAKSALHFRFFLEFIRRDLMKHDCHGFDRTTALEKTSLFFLAPVEIFRNSFVSNFDRSEAAKGNIS
jgi:hypothetical protein